jgi:hypothetical protein
LSGFTGLLHGGKQQGNQNGDDGDHHQQFNERKPTTTIRRHRMLSSPEKELPGRPTLVEPLTPGWLARSWLAKMLRLSLNVTKIV